MNSILFHGSAYLDFCEWAEIDNDIFIKIQVLIKDVSRTPFKGLGKPEPLKHQLKGYWSRRITQEHRFIYKMENNVIQILSVRGHYEDK
jgi:toxin YoeB